MAYDPSRSSSDPKPNDPSASSDALAPSLPTPGSQHGQSPLDWTSFMSFQPTPPITSAGPAGNGMRPPSGSGDIDYNQQNSLAGYSSSSSGQYGGAGVIGNNGGGYGQSPIAGPSRPYQYSANPSSSTTMPSPSYSNHQLPSSSDGNLQQQRGLQAPTARNGKNGGKGKSPATNSNNQSQSPSQAQAPQYNRRQSSNSNNNQSSIESSSNMVNSDGLSLDPAAFTRDIRFQIPSFLGSQMTGAPAFPPGGEAWSGMTSASFFGNDGLGGLTPGQLFNNMFNVPQDQNAGFPGMGEYGNQGIADGSSNLGSAGGGVGVGVPGWDGWNGGYKQDGSNQYSSNNNQNQQNNMGAGATTFYVNPNAQQSRISSTGIQSNRPAAINIPGISQNDLPPQSPHSNQNQQRRNTIPTPTSNPNLANPIQNLNTNQTPAQNQATILNSTLLSNPITGFPYVPSISTPTNPASVINIASSSTAPYAPPSNTQQLLTAPVAPPSMMGPSLTEGPGLYSTTGFDMVGVLAKVASRKDPKTVLGPVDLSCSFVVVDIRRYDSPIVYASPTFTALTGYELPQMLGRNCRFLQSPDGEVVKGSKRKYTDNVAVAHLKRMLNAGKECQASLINYRRGGIPFINLVTVVPIPWDQGNEIVYHVGFQVDLVEQPNAILRNMRDGSYQVNYTVANPPQPPLRPAGKEIGTIGLSKEIIDILGPKVNNVNFGIGEDGAKMDWLKMVLENSDDFVHVLSLKGLFQYVSPSVRRVLEYEPEDLLNKNISDICHPSDIVPLMRELKDSTHSPADGNSAKPVNLVFRIRRKNSGYIWIECAGRLHIEAGKGRKAVILSGRARSVPSLPWETVAKHGGLGDNEFWARISFNGLFLHATSTVQDVLGMTEDDLIGLSLFSLLPNGGDGPPSEEKDKLSNGNGNGETKIGLSSSNASPSTTVFNALKTMTSAAGKQPDTMTISHKMINGKKEVIDVVTILYAPRNRPELPPRSDSETRSSSDQSEDNSSTEDNSNTINTINGKQKGVDNNASKNKSRKRAGSTDSDTISGIKPSSIVAQIKLLSTPNPNPSTSTTSSNNGLQIAKLTNARPIAHSGSSNVFEELETTRGTSWQYELHQLRLLNRRLKDDVAAARSVASRSSLRKNGIGGSSGGVNGMANVDGSMTPRKRRPDGSLIGDGMSGNGAAGQSGQNGVAGNGSTANGGGGGGGSVQQLPEQFNAAPRHQLAPGFGLVAPGMPNPYF